MWLSTSTSYSCHQHIWSPSSVTNIDVTLISVFNKPVKSILLILRDFYYSCYQKCHQKWTAIDKNQRLNNLDLLFLERYPSTKVLIQVLGRWHIHESWSWKSLMTPSSFTLGCLFWSIVSSGSIISSGKIILIHFDELFETESKWPLYHAIRTYMILYVFWL